MRILHIVSNLSIRSGVMTVLMNYYRHMKNTEVQFAFLYFDEREDTYEKEILDLGGIIYKFSRKTYPVEWNRFCKANYKKFEIVHNHELYLSFLFINIKKKLGNEVFISHAHATKFSDVKLKELRNRILSCPASIISDYLLACSNDAGNALFGTHFSQNGYILNNAIEINRFKFNVQVREQMREELGIDENAFVVGHVGNFTPPKNHSKIIRVFKELLDIKSDAILLLVGDGYMHADIKQMVNVLGINERVIFIGVTSHVETYLNAMDIFIFPSLFEGLGIAFVEAQVNGLSCACSSTVPQEANILIEKNVILKLEDEPIKWAQAILGLDVCRYATMERIKDAGYDITEEASRLKDFYEAVLSRKPVLSLKRGKLHER